MQTKDFDFGLPGIKKKIYKIYVTYLNDTAATTVPILTTSINGAEDDEDAVVSGEFVPTDNIWTVEEFKPNVNVKNCYSIQIRIKGNTNQSFQINDISIVYRVKGIK